MRGLYTQLSPSLVAVVTNAPDAAQFAFWPDLAPQPRTCQVCGHPLDLDARGDARYCSTTCRVRAFRVRTKRHL
jgi:predicted nucleic acid-binding Zn ribbon protein